MGCHSHVANDVYTLLYHHDKILSPEKLTGGIKSPAILEAFIYNVIVYLLQDLRRKRLLVNESFSGTKKNNFKKES